MNATTNTKRPRLLTSAATRLTRRDFLKTAAAAAGAIAAPNLIPASALGLDGAVAPSERIVLGAIGIGNRGTYVLGCFLEEEDVQFVAIADVKAARRQAVKEKADAKYGNQNCVMYRDLRELLARSDIDAVLIATGPNWHALAAITAAKAG
ncbi:MAG: Gfo/Idh/MocA family oxidoreductase, partial [Verrucomicrobia bacterium]|nr:Gfo/Idh/MocA family oxidoreductase [Verrucomicrobiota bacterium]